MTRQSLIATVVAALVWAVALGLTLKRSAAIYRIRNRIAALRHQLSIPSRDRLESYANAWGIEPSGLEEILWGNREYVTMLIRYHSNREQYPFGDCRCETEEITEKGLDVIHEWCKQKRNL